MNLAGISYQSISVDLLKGEHKTEAYLNRNPQGLVPVLEIDGHSMTQSLAILEYLNDTREMGLISSDPTSAAQERCDCPCHCGRYSSRVQCFGCRLRRTTIRTGRNSC